MKKNTRIGKGIIAGLKEALRHERGKISLRSTEFELPSPAPDFSAKEIKRIRVDVFKMSQPVFAKVLNVSSATIKSWEQGDKAPSGPASRLLQLAKKKPEVLIRI